MLRTSAFWKVQSLTNEMENYLINCLESILNTTIDETQWIQATLSISKGGLDIRKISDVCLPAFLSSLHGNTEIQAKYPEHPSIQKHLDSINVERIVSGEMLESWFLEILGDMYPICELMIPTKSYLKWLLLYYNFPKSTFPQLQTNLCLYLFSDMNLREIRASRYDDNITTPTVSIKSGLSEKLLALFAFRQVKYNLNLILRIAAGSIPSKMERQELQTSYTNGDELVFAHVVFRHGIRNIINPYPNDPYKDETHWPEGFAQLTNDGKRQLYCLGQYLRRRYSLLIGPKYSSNKIYIQSTDLDRTIMSAQAVFAGLYPPNTEVKWHDEIPWKPVPVHTIPWSLDHILSAGKHCPKYEVALQKYIKDSPEINRLLTEYADLLIHWTQQSGREISTIGDVFQLYDTLKTEKKHNKRIPEWAEKAMEDGIMECIAKYHLKSECATPQLARIKSGFLIKEILERFSQKINSSLNPDRSLWLYSAHDVTISNLLNSLGLFELHFPPTAASLHFELYKSDENKHYFQIFYRKSNEEDLVPLKIPGCGEKCTLEQFYDQFKQIIPDDFDLECRTG